MITYSFFQLFLYLKNENTANDVNDVDESNDLDEDKAGPSRVKQPKRKIIESDDESSKQQKEVL